MTWLLKIGEKAILNLDAKFFALKFFASEGV